MEVKITGLGRLNRAIQVIVDRADDCTPSMKAIGVMQVRSIGKNFDIGGRPTRWRQSMRAKVQGGKTLLDQSVLRNSVTFEAGRRNVTIGPSGPAAVYGHAHQVGAAIPERVPKKGKALRFLSFRDGKFVFARSARAFRLPKREWLVFQDEDIKWARRAVLDHVMGRV